MSLAPGTRLGSYEVTSAIGEGGMGEVYRARDTKLKRDVALKVLPESFANDADRVARFTREAQTLASLNHPHIAGIYGLDEGQVGPALPAQPALPAIRFIVMELVEGEDLSELIDRVRAPSHGLPIDDALAIARQIAEALEAAHERGIVHRDLKPANIKVRPDGTVKVLDFGLAKEIERSGGSGRSGGPGDFTHSPTITSPAMTQVGVILGTAAYMSPEQAKGRGADKRSDVWAFGCVLYEMLTGARPFDGEDMTDVLGAVVRLEPDWTRVPATVPPAIRTLLRGCLVKDPRQRVGDIAAVLFVLKDPSLGAPQVIAPAPAPPAKPALWRVALPWVAGILVGAIPAVFFSMRPAAPPPRVAHFVIPSSVPNLPFRVGTTVSAVGISPDGSRVVYRLHDGPLQLNNGVLYMRELGQVEATPIRGTEGALNFFFSPDGNWIGFNHGVENTLKRISRAGGTAEVICALDSALRGGSWGVDGTIVFATEASKGLRRVPAMGGESEVLTKADAPGTDHWWPEVLPGGKGVVFTVYNRANPPRSRIAALSPTGAISDVTAGAVHPQFAATGHLLFGADNNTLRAVPFDTSTLKAVGSVTTVVEGVAIAPTGAANFALAADGTLVYARGQTINLTPRTLTWVDRQGRQEPINVPPRSYTYARLSPDGTRVALDSRDQEFDIWIWDLARETLQRLTTDPGLNRSPVWTPDGTRIAFTQEREGSGEGVFWQRSDGSGTPELLSVSPAPQGPVSFSPDGKRLLLHTPLNPPYDLGMLVLDGERREEMLLKARYSESNGQFSPDGRWLAYESMQSGRLEIYLAPFPDLESSKMQVSVAGGTRPLWSTDGRELFYFVEPDTIMAVSVTPGPTLALGRPAAVVKGSYARPANTGTHYGVSPDGKRFLLLKDVETAGASQSAAPEIHLVQHWTEELKTRVPVGK